MKGTNYPNFHLGNSQRLPQSRPAANRIHVGIFGNSVAVGICSDVGMDLLSKEQTE